MTNFTYWFQEEIVTEESGHMEEVQETTQEAQIDTDMTEVAEPLQPVEEPAQEPAQEPVQEPAPTPEQAPPAEEALIEETQAVEGQPTIKEAPQPQTEIPQPTNLEPVEFDNTVKVSNNS